MATETTTATGPEQDLTAEEKISRLREIFADAPEVGKKALENVLRELTSQVSKTPPPPIVSAGRAGSRLVAEADGLHVGHVHEAIHHIAHHLGEVNPTPPQHWPPDRFDIIWTFTPDEHGWRFAQIPQLLLPGDLPHPIVARRTAAQT
jgi:hypothetical protein